MRRPSFPSSSKGWLIADRKGGETNLNLLQGTLDLLILQALAWGAMHGYGVSRLIRERTNEVLLVDDAALYQALHRLERKGSIEAEWGVSDNNRRAKYYSLTPARRRLLRHEADHWRRYAGAISAVLDPA